MFDYGVSLKMHYSKYIYEVECIPYDELIDGLIETCDSFSLVTFFTPFANSLAEYKEYGISEEESKKILEELNAVYIEQSKIRWDRTPEETKDRLPDFEKILDDAVAYRKKISASSETEDEFSEKFDLNHSRYSESSSFVRCMYSDQYSYGRTEFIHKEMIKNENERDVLEELKRFNNELLLKNHIRYELSHSWPFTITSELMIIHYFKCNEETKKWLKRRKDIFDFDVLEDLDFFRDGRCVMGVCTHEEWSFLEIPWRKEDLYPQN